MTRAALGAARAALLGAAAACGGCGAPARAVSTPQTSPAPAPSSTSTTSPARLERAQINRQDRPGARLVARQRAAAAARPLLPALPIRADGVLITIAGLAPGGQRTLLELRSRRGRRHALAVYRRQLRRYGDSGRAYRVRVRR